MLPFIVFQHRKAYKKWYNRSPEEFRFSVKAPRLITHYKIFKESERLLGDFYASIYQGLKEKPGCVLFQLPSSVVYNEDILKTIIENLDPSFKNVIELRDTGWWNEKVYKQLTNSGISFCGISHPKLPDEVKKNTGVLYYRFHGVPVLYKSSYDADFVKKIAAGIKEAGKIEEAYIYFNNTWGTGGVTNAKQMHALVLC